jgi:hypothetical protein
MRKIFLAGLLSMAWSASAQTLSFNRTDITFPTATGSISVGAADFNNDGIPDVAVLNNGINFGDASVSILLGNGDGTFQSPKDTAIGTHPRAFAISDFNLDGIMDVAGNDLNDGRVLCFAR